METRAVSIIMRQHITCPAPVITTQLVSVMRAVTIKLFSRFCCNEYSVNGVRLENAIQLCLTLFWLVGYQIVTCMPFLLCLWHGFCSESKQPNQNRVKCGNGLLYSIQKMGYPMIPLTLQNREQFGTSNEIFTKGSSSN